MTTPDPTAVALSLQVAALHQHVAELESKVAVLEHADTKRRKPRESITWHDITDEARELEVARLRGFERDVVLPVLGYHLLECWPLHVPALVRMEIIHQLWVTLWLSKRTPSVLASQAEFFLRHLPGLADDIRSICVGCEHARPKRAAEVA